MRVDTTGGFWLAAVLLTAAVVGVAAALSGCSSNPSYSSPNAAARAFSEQTYRSSSYIRHEYACTIYSRTSNGVTTYGYTTPSPSGPHGGSISMKVPFGTTLVAYAHTHPNSNDFSDTDINTANTFQINAYVVGPNLELQRYNVDMGTTDNLGSITPIELTDEQKSALVSEFQLSWDTHIQEGCDFNCNTMTWPNE